MSGITKIFEELPGWTFEVDEISAGVFHVKAVDRFGRSVEAVGTDPDGILFDCQQSAKKIQNNQEFQESGIPGTSYLISRESSMETMFNSLELL